MSDQALMKYFSFDEADLNANRSGGITEKQRKKLLGEEKSAKQSGIGFSILGLFLIAISTIFPIVFFPMAYSAWQEGQYAGAIGSAIGAIVWLVIWGAIGVVMFVSGFHKPSSKVTLKNVTGPINLVGVEESGSHGHTYTEFYLHMGGTKFDVEEELANVMMQGDVYTVYYVEGEVVNSGIEILSLERASKG